MGENENGKDEAPMEKQAELADVPRHADFLRLALPAAGRASEHHQPLSAREGAHRAGGQFHAGLHRHCV